MVFATSCKKVNYYHPTAFFFHEMSIVCALLVHSFNIKENMSLINRVKEKIYEVFTKDKNNIFHSKSINNGESSEFNNTSEINKNASEQVESFSNNYIVPNKAPLLTEAQTAILKKILRNSTSEQRLVTRSQIILLYSKGTSKNQIAKDLNMERKTIRKWCSRWDEARDILADLETKGIPDKAYQAVISEVLNDETRDGAPNTFTAEQITRIIAMACEVLDSSDAPVSHWTNQDLADEAVNRKIVEKISDSSIGRFLNEANLKPHLDRYWLNSPDKDTEEFNRGVKEVNDLYEQAPEFHENGVNFMSTDEKSGIQALERLHETHPAKPGENRPKELREHSYERKGTLCLIANFEVATGKIVAPSIGPSRTEEDFVKHIAQTVKLDPTGKWIFLADQLNTHQSEGLVKFIAKQCEIDEDLGVKGKSGILANMISRKTFLSDENHRIRFVYTPRHASWLNQIEIWFSILVRRLLKRGSFSSLENLKIRILKFIDFFNQTMAKAFKWTYKGRALTI